MAMDLKTLLARQSKLIDAVRTAPIVNEMGMKLSYTDDGEAVWDMPYNPLFDHALQGVHGGVFATLLDNAGWFTAAPYYDHWIATIELQVRFLRHVQAKHLQAIGHLVRAGKRIATATMEIKTIEDGELVAIGSGTFSPTSAQALF